MESKAPSPCASPDPQLVGLRSQGRTALCGPCRTLLLSWLHLRRTEGTGWCDAFPTLDLVVFLPGNTSSASSCLHLPLKRPFSPSSLFSPQGHCLSFECPSWRAQGPGRVLATQGGCCPTSEPPFIPCPSRGLCDWSTPASQTEPPLAPRVCPFRGHQRPSPPGTTSPPVIPLYPAALDPSRNPQISQHSPRAAELGGGH